MRVHKILGLCFLLGVSGASPFSSVEAAGPVMLKLLRVLKDRGSISQQEYDEMVAAVADESAASSQKTVVALPVVESKTNGSVTVPPKAAESAQGSVKSAAPLTTDSFSKILKSKWYERLGVKGYTQFRYTSILSQDGADLMVPNDRSVAENSSFYIRRARVVLSGDVSEHLLLYIQPDLNGSPTSGDFSVQLRDLYGDISFDTDKEYRIRIGQSKVPFGWSNLQSSANRAPLERPDAINSVAEGERDIGAFFYWAPDAIRKRYADLVKLGLKGSGDYGVLGLGANSGQGLNRLDFNGDPHFVARASYPFQLPNGQFFETGVQAYSGRFVTSSQAIGSGASAITPLARPDGTADQRAGVSAVWYPQPFGVEAEWNFGIGPELSSDRRTISAGSLNGGYVQLSYKDDNRLGAWFPFLRWQSYQGGRKFAINAPSERVNELDFGIEWAPWPAVEFTVQYTRTFERTNTKIAPYLNSESADRISVQAQINY